MSVVVGIVSLLCMLSGKGFFVIKLTIAYTITKNKMMPTIGTKINRTNVFELADSFLFYLVTIHYPFVKQS